MIASCKIIKKHILFISIVTVQLFLSNLFAESIFFVQQDFGLRYGMINELLYQKNSNGDFAKLSELNWELKNAFYIETKAGLEWNKFIFNLSGRIYLPLKSGIMKDSDWLDLNNIKNIYSISENSLSTSFSLSTQTLYKFQIIPFITIMPGLSLEYEYILFEAKNGYGWYASMHYTGTGKNEAWDSEYAKFFPSGKLAGIDYLHQSFYTWIDLGIMISPIKKLNLFISGSCTPFLYKDCIDHHKKIGGGNGTFYYDVVKGWFPGFKGVSSVSFEFSKWGTILLKAEISYIKELSGDAYSSSSLDGPYQKLNGYSSGASASWFDISASFKIKPQLFSGKFKRIRTSTILL